MVTKVHVRKLTGAEIVATIALCVVTLACLFAPFTELHESSLWLDELATVQIANPTGAFMSTYRDRIVTDVNPPAFYVLQHVWLKFFTDLQFGSRLLSSLFGVATVALVAIMAPKRFSWPTASVMTSLVVTGFAYIYYATEARSYMMAVFLATIQTFIFQDGLSRLDAGHSLRRTVTWLSLFTILNGLSHYYGLFYGGALMGSLMLEACLKKSWRNAASIVVGGLVTLAVTGGYAAWALKHSLYQLDASWIPNDWGYYRTSIKEYLWLAFGGHHAFLWTLATLALIIGGLALRGENALARRCVRVAFPYGIAVLIMIVMAVSVSTLWIPTISARYLLISVPAFWFAIAATLEATLRSGPVWSRPVALASAVLTAVTGMQFTYVSGGPNREEWRNSAAFVASVDGCKHGPVPVYGGVKREQRYFFDFYLDPSYGIVPTPVETGIANPQCPVRLWSVHGAQDDPVIVDLLHTLGDKAEVRQFDHVRAWDCWPLACRRIDRARDVGALVILAKH